MNLAIQKRERGVGRCTVEIGNWWFGTKELIWAAPDLWMELLPCCLLLFMFFNFGIFGTFTKKELFCAGHFFGWNYYTRGDSKFRLCSFLEKFHPVAIIQPELNCIRMHIGLQLFAYFGGAIFFILFIIITTFPVIKLLNLSLIEGCAIE